MWARLFLFLVVGYLTMTRSFAYLGLPAAKLFIGELSIGGFLLARPRAVFDPWLAALAAPSPLGYFAVAFTSFLSYGIFELIRGLILGHSVVLALQGFAFHYYPVCFLLGIWAGSKDPALLRRTLRIGAWVNGLYGLLFIVVLNTIPLALPGTVDVRLFGQPAGCAVFVLGLLSLEPDLKRVAPLILLNLAVMLGLQVRAEFLGFFIGLLVWASLSRQMARLLAGCAAVAALLVLGFVTDFHMPAPSTRGGQISTRDIIGRVVSPVNEELAAEYSQSAKTTAGTAEWRMVWWRAIWDNVHQTTTTALIGEGYGFPLGDLVGYSERDIRTPHNVFFYALAYGGWIGVALFFLLQASIAHRLWVAWSVSGNACGLAIWALFFCGAFFGNAFETPFGAIPLYLISGLAAAQGLRPLPAYANSVGAQLLSTARG